MKIYIINPDDGKAVSVEEWRKDSDPTRARILAIDTDEGHTLLMSKEYLPDRYTFEEAQKACAEFITAELGNSGVVFRCPTRKECIDIYDARFQGLDKAISLIGGNFAKELKRHWTCERDADTRCVAYDAWFSNSYGGFAGYDLMCGKCSALPVALLKKIEIKYKHR